MRLIEDLLNKMMSLHRDFWIRKFDLRSIWMFYKCYNLAINYLGIEDKRIKVKNRLWYDYLNSNINSSEIKKIKFRELLLKEISTDLKIVSQAYEKIVIENKESGASKSKLWRKGVLAVSIWDIEDFLLGN